jgi:hypothetical protein
MIRRWPPLLWPLMSLASLLILRGGTPKVGDWALVAGGAIALVVLALSIYLATASWPGRPRTPAMNWAIIGATLFYLAAAAAAAAGGTGYAIAGLAAGVIPISALALIVATARATTLATEYAQEDDEETWLDREPWRRARTRPP